MSNIMSLKGIMNHPRRNGFDLSEKNAFSAKAGELLPVMTKEVIPGDKFKINLSAFTRTMPVDTAAFTRLREYYDFYFVPIKQLWRYADSFFTNMNDTQTATGVLSGTVGTFTEHPYIASDDIEEFITNCIRAYEDDDDDFSKDVFGLPRSYGMNKLLQYLGYVGNFGNRDADKNTARTSLSFNIFPLLAYQKIYSDYYRFDQWEKVNPSLFNIDYINKPDSMNVTFPLYPDMLRDSWFDMRYCNWNKDLFTGLIPSPQFGDTAVASPLSGILAGSGQVNLNNSAGSSDDVNINLDNRTTAGLSIFALRQCEARQKWAEISGSHKQNFKDQMKAHWNVNVSDERSGMCKYLGGVSSNININEVVNSNLIDGSSADIAGKGSGVSNGHITFESHDYGIIMCIYHCVPLLDYTPDGISPLNLKKDFTDYAIPELDSLGMQAVPMEQLLWVGTNGDDDNMLSEHRELGYAPRYIDYKTSVDRVRGAFVSTLKNWVTPVDANALRAAMYESVMRYGKAITYPFFKVNPAVLNTIFAQDVNGTVDTDQFLVNAYFDCKVVRNLDYNGLPY